MASLFDVLDALQAIAITAVAPLQCSELVDVGQGWPLGDDLDKAMPAGRVLVSVYSVPGTSSDPGQVMCWDVEVVSAPVYGMTASVSDTGFSLTGQPCVGEYASVLLDRKNRYSYASVQGDLAETVCANLVAQIAVKYPGTTRTDASVSVPKFHDLQVRIGGVATVGEKLHRQRQQFRVIVWAPSPALRAAVATSLDMALKRNLTFAMPDTSTALAVYQRHDLTDDQEKTGVYRADLVYSVTWDSYDVTEAFEITTVVPSFQSTSGPSF